MITADMPLGAVLERHISLIPLVNRFGIRLGTGDKSIEQVCRAAGVEPMFMLTLINTFLFENYFPEHRLKEFHKTLIGDYLEKTNQYYQYYQLPNIERHLGVLIKTAGPENKNLMLIGSYFERIKSQILANSLVEQGQLSDLVSIMVRHLSGAFDDNMAYAVIFALNSLARDVRQHNRIRSLISSEQ